MRADPANATRSRAVSVNSPLIRRSAPPSPSGEGFLCTTTKKEYPHATLRNHRHELRGLRKPCGKSRCGGAGCGIRRRKPADQLDAGRLRPRRRPRCHGTAHPPCRGRRRVRRVPRLRRERKRRARGHRDSQAQKAPDCQPLLPCAAYVRLDGPHDWPAAGQCVPRRRLARHPVRGHPAGADPARLLDQPRVFPLGLEGHQDPRARHGYPRRPRRWRVAGLRRVRHRHDLHRPVHRQRRSGHAVPPRPLF